MQKEIEALSQPRPGDFCLLCGGEPSVIGVFVPDEPERWGAPEGKTRLIRYCLCRKCNEKKDKMDLTEKVIRSQIFGGSVNAI